MRSTTIQPTINPCGLPVIEAETGEARRTLAETLLPLNHSIWSNQWPGEVPPVDSYPFAVVVYPGYAGRSEATLYAVPMGGGGHE